MYTRQTLLSTDQQIAGHGFSVNHNWLYDAAIICLVQIVLSSENAAPQLLTATEKSAKLALK